MIDSGIYHMELLARNDVDVLIAVLPGHDATEVLDVLALEKATYTKLNSTLITAKLPGRRALPMLRKLAQVLEK